MAKNILIPQFSIRWLLGVTTACAAVFAIFGLAVRGSYWAAGVSIAIVSLAVVLLVHASVFGLVWAYSVAASQLRRRGVGPGRSPFLQDSAAPGAPAAATAGHGAPRSDKDVPATPIILD